MATCIDCVGFDFCKNSNGTTEFYLKDIALNNVEENCPKFKDRSKFVDLKCTVGDSVYIISDTRIKR